jgi:hypothetical protein
MDDDTVLKDNILKQYSGSKCVPIPATVTASGGIITGDSVEWTNVPGRTNFVYTYQCQVE